MNEGERIDDLVRRWLQGLTESREIAVHELCHDYPDLISAVRPRIEALRMRIKELLRPWKQGFVEGRDIPVEELCYECPELISAVRPCIEALRGGLKEIEQIINPPLDPTFPQTSPQKILPSLTKPRGVGKGKRYRLDRLIGEGGFGQVWQGFDNELQRVVAVKLPKQNRIRHEAEAAFLDEARKVARLKHPAIVPVYDVGRHRTSWYIVSQFIEGIDLGERMKQGRLPVRESVRIVEAVANALEYTHNDGIIHQDIKPANILIGNDDQVYLTDFGIAFDMEQGTEGERGVSGTLPYMSPEQLGMRQGRIDGRTDIFSLGVVFYELLTGRRPDPAMATSNIRGTSESGQRPSDASSDEESPECLLRICEKCLSARQDDRYETGRNLADALRKAAAGLLTESEWLGCTDPLQMFGNLYNMDYYGALRKMRLFACACVRHGCPNIVDEQSRNALEVAERYADRMATIGELRVAEKAAWRVRGGADAEAAAATTNPCSWTAAQATARLATSHMQCLLLKDLFGPQLFRSFTFNFAWLEQNGGAVRRFAEEIYEGGQFDQMSSLGEAMREAGCDDEELLAHCRMPCPHIRGCWVLDLLRGGWQSLNQPNPGLGKTSAEYEVIVRAVDLLTWREKISKEEALRHITQAARDRKIKVAQAAQMIVEASVDS